MKHVCSCVWKLFTYSEAVTLSSGLAIPNITLRGRLTYCPVITKFGMKPVTSWTVILDAKVSRGRLWSHSQEVWQKADIRFLTTFAMLSTHEFPWEKWRRNLVADIQHLAHLLGEFTVKLSSFIRLNLILHPNFLFLNHCIPCTTYVMHCSLHWSTYWPNHTLLLSIKCPLAVSHFVTVCQLHVTI